MNLDSWAVVDAVVKGGHRVRMAIRLSDVVAMWDSPDGVIVRHTNGGTTTVLARAAEVAALLGVGDATIPDDWFAGVGQ